MASKDQKPYYADPSSLDPSQAENKDASNPFGGGLTKSQHRNPDLHVLGDNLPSNIVAYTEGGASLQPDVGGNTPLLLRSRNVITGGGGTQSVVFNNTNQQISGFTNIVTCPAQAAAGAFVRCTLHLGDVRPVYLGGVSDVFTQLMIFANGVQVPGAQGVMWFNTNIGAANPDIPVTVAAVVTIPGADQPINPGQSITFQAMAYGPLTATPKYRYDMVVLGDRSFFRTELYY